MDTNFDQIDFGPLKPYLDDDDITDISYDNGGQIHLKTLSKGIFRIENPAINNSFIEKLAFQCSNVMGKTFNMAHPFLDAESTELRLAFIHDSVSRNGVACVLRKTPAKIRLQKEKIVADKYVELDIIDFLEQCVLGHCNIIVSGETGSGKTELVKYLASKIAENEKIITIEDTLELHLDRIFPHRDIVSMKTNNIASYTDILEACMRQNPKWILLSEVRSAEAVLAVRNSISSGHYILSTIHADKASSIPNRMYSLLESNQDLDQFMSSICRYIQLGIYVRGYTDKATHNFKREIAEVTEFYVTNDTNEAKHNVIYRKGADGKVIRNNPSPYLIDYLEVQGVFLPKELQNMAGDAESSDASLVPLSEDEIADDQTVTFTSDGVKIEEKSSEDSTMVNPIEVISNGASFNDKPVSEISTTSENIPESSEFSVDNQSVFSDSSAENAQIIPEVQNTATYVNPQVPDNQPVFEPNAEVNTDIYSGVQEPMVSTDMGSVPNLNMQASPEVQTSGQVNAYVNPQVSNIAGVVMDPSVQQDALAQNANTLPSNSDVVSDNTDVLF